VAVVLTQCAQVVGGVDGRFRVSGGVAGEGEWDGGAEKLEGAALDGSRVGEFVEALTGEGDSVAGEASQVCDQPLIVVDGEIIGGFLGGVGGFRFG
jgi:hypothetical protein